ncbi:hypothetical protein CANARDRAFT_175730 [[Candida] arabinofermentans NRRL YB-2248]|uniref:Uncharacterized protein n=1 Tax=[Candida] arabinofermentans NRRL YB-2248 TaxID=983967 RepID=A0A1E4T2K6_9ASCO|nr:hypothetical protein CANARDRAFT_175730 [[Candida] arabinofermentans NRRL YB-2248]
MKLLRYNLNNAWRFNSTLTGSRSVSKPDTSATTGTNGNGKGNDLVLNQIFDVYSKTNKHLMNNEPSSMIKERNIIDKLYQLLPNKITKLDDSLFLKLNKIKRLRDLPPPPPKIFNSDTINSYASELISMSYIHYPGSMKFVDESVIELMNIGDFHKSTYVDVLIHFGSPYNKDKIDEVRSFMKKSFVSEDIDVFNVLIHQIFRKDNNVIDRSEALDVVENELFNMKVMGLEPDLNTLLIFYSDCGWFNERILEKLIELKLPLIKINNKIVKNKYKAGESVNSIVEFLKLHQIDTGTPVINSIIECHLLSNNYQNAWDFMIEKLNDLDSEFNVNTRTIKHFVSYFIRNGELYNALAMCDYLSNLHGISDRQPIYVMMLEMLLNDIKFKNINNWCLITRYLYLKSEKSIPSNLKQKLITKGKLIDIDFQIDEVGLLSEEIESMNEITNSLVWLQEPIIKLNENTNKFVDCVNRYF